MSEGQHYTSPWPTPRGDPETSEYAYDERDDERALRSPGDIVKTGGEYAIVVGENEDGDLLVAVLTGRVTAVTLDQIDKEEDEK